MKLRKIILTQRENATEASLWEMEWGGITKDAYLFFLEYNRKLKPTCQFLTSVIRNVQWTCFESESEEIY